MAGFVDDFVEVRLQSYASEAAHLLQPDQIWADADAASIGGGIPSGTSWLRYVGGGWDGLDMPDYDISYTPLASRIGELELSRAVRGREITTPVLSDVMDKTEIAKLKRVLSGDDRVLVGFRYPGPPVLYRYLPLCRYRTGINISARGYQPWSDFPLTLKSEWPYFTKPHLAAAGGTANLSPTGAANIMWGVWMTSLTAANLTITATATGKPIQTKSIGLTSQPARFLFIGGGPYYGYKPLLADNTPDPAIRRSTDTGEVFEFLSAGTTYAVRMTGGTGRIFWIENFEGA